MSVVKGDLHNKGGNTAGMFGKNSNGKAMQTKARYAKDQSVYDKIGPKSNGGKGGTPSLSAKPTSGNAGVVHSRAKTWGKKGY